MAKPPISRALKSAGRALIACASLGVVVSPAGLAAPPDGGQQKRPAAPTSSNPRFETDVLPIFQAHCARCHGAKPRKAELNLTSRDGAFQGSESGPVIVPGKALRQSLLLKVLREGRMPPEKKDRLSDAKVETIRRWIAAGARRQSRTHARPRVRSLPRPSTTSAR